MNRPALLANIIVGGVCAALVLAAGGPAWAAVATYLIVHLCSRS